MKRTCVFAPNISIIPDSIDRLAVIKPRNAFFVHFRVGTNQILLLLLQSSTPAIFIWKAGR